MRQRLIRKYDIRRHFFLGCDLAAQRAECLEERLFLLRKFVCPGWKFRAPAALFAASSCLFLPLLRHLHLDWFRCFQESSTFFRQFDNRILIRRDKQILLHLEEVKHLAQMHDALLRQLPIMRILIHPVIADLYRIRPVNRVENHRCSIALSARLHTA